MSKVLAVVGAQYGSEGKGVIVNKIADEYQVHVRTGGPNAGHSFWWKGRAWVMQVIPCGWTNPDATLVIGRGMLLDIKQLLAEIAMIEEAFPDIRRRIAIDAKCAVLDERHYAEEGGVNGELHQRIGSTGKGVGAARRARMDRDPSRIKLFGEVAFELGLDDLLCDDTPGLLRVLMDEGKDVLLEGTQGSGLSLIHGPWPYVTSADTNAAGLAADAGISPRLVTDVMLVARTYPIRVAGNSGPLVEEITWEELSERLGKPVTERTTVTKKTRRIGEWDWELMDAAATLNAPTSIALTFADYMNPVMEGRTDIITPDVLDFTNELTQRYGCPVEFVGVGGEGWQVIDMRSTLLEVTHG